MASPKLPFTTFRRKNLPLSYTTDDLLNELKHAKVDAARVSLAQVPDKDYQDATVTLDTAQYNEFFQNDRDTGMMGFTILSSGAEPTGSIE